MRLLRFVVCGLLAVVLLACGLDVPGGDFPPVTPTPNAPTPTPVIINAPVATATPVPLAPTATPLPLVTQPSEPTGPTEAAFPAPTEPPPAAEEAPVTEGMVAVPAGVFVMGSSEGLEDERPAHEVDLPAFQIDQTEVTNAQFALFAESTGYQTQAEESGSPKTWRDEWQTGEEDFPVVRVSWADAIAYCEWAGKYLPTEAEWEKAARGPDAYTFPWGNDYDPAKVNGKDSGIRGPVAVSSYPDGASPYGALNMAGNVREWTADPGYLPYAGNSVGSPYYGEDLRVLRGGGWFDVADDLRTTRRNPTSPEAANWDIGFRCAQ